jgi:hypothetical protein
MGIARNSAQRAQQQAAQKNRARRRGIGAGREKALELADQLKTGTELRHFWTRSDPSCDNPSLLKSSRLAAAGGSAAAASAGERAGVLEVWVGNVWGVPLPD